MTRRSGEKAAGEAGSRGVMAWAGRTTAAGPLEDARGVARHGLAHRLDAEEDDDGERWRQQEQGLRRGRLALRHGLSRGSGARRRACCGCRGAGAVPLRAAPLERRRRRRPSSTPPAAAAAAAAAAEAAAASGRRGDRASPRRCSPWRRSRHDGLSRRGRAAAAATIHGGNCRRASGSPRRPSCRRGGQAPGRGGGAAAAAAKANAKAASPSTSGAGTEPAGAALLEFGADGPRPRRWCGA